MGEGGAGVGRGAGRGSSCDPGFVVQGVIVYTAAAPEFTIKFLLPLFQVGQLSVTGESMCTKYWLTA